MEQYAESRGTGGRGNNKWDERKGGKRGRGPSEVKVFLRDGRTAKGEKKGKAQGKVGDRQKGRPP